jgi:two-component system OmpR family response regulator
VRVLIVEDEAHLAESIARGLQHEGFDVDITHDGLDALWRIRESQYGAVLLDILLPGMNGYVLCRTLRDEQNWTPILMLTAKDGEYDEAEALDTGADDYLSKPFSFVVLTARLRVLLRRGSTPQPVVLSVGDLSLDLVARRCRRGARTIDLTPREFALLETLMRTPGAVLSRRRLLEDVWGSEFDPSSTVVEVYVRYLRIKIDEAFGRRSLQTLRGHGYRLVDDLEDADAPT